MQSNPKGETNRSPFFLFPRLWLRGSSGFTLIELSIVLVILGILVSLGASALGPLTKRAKFAETRETVKAMKEAIIAYAVNKGEMPCGKYEGCAPDKGFDKLANPIDGFGKELFYLYSDKVSNTNLCSISSTSLKLTVCDVNGCRDIENIAFIVGSKGWNMNRQIDGPEARVTTGMAPTPITAYAPGITNTVADGYSLSTADLNRADPNRNEEFDDIYAYVTLHELQAKIPCTACTAYQIYNTGPKARFMNLLTLECSEVESAEIVRNTIIGRGNFVKRYPTDAEDCNGTPLYTISFQTAGDADSDKDCRVNSIATGLTN